MSSCDTTILDFRSICLTWYLIVVTATTTVAASPALLWPMTFPEGTPVILDPASALYSAIGAGNLRAYVQGQDDRGGAALSN